MGYLAVLCALLPLACSTALAQNFPKVEASAGYSYTRFHPASGVAANCNGGYGSFTGNFTNWLGVTGGVDVCRVSSGSNAATYMIGPKFAYRKCCRVTPFANALLGGVHVTPGFPSVAGAANAFAFKAGGGVDISITCLVAIRVIEADYLLTRLNSNNQGNFRLNVGIVLRRW
jgi:hypothetical protein